MQLEHLLTDEQKSIREMVRKFVAKEILPIREQLEEDYSLVEGVHQKLVDLGIQRAGYPPEYGGGLRTNTVFYINQMYFLFSPILGKINAQWYFNLKAGVGYRWNPSMGVHLAYEYRSVVDLEDLFISDSSLHSFLLYFSFRIN